MSHATRVVLTDWIIAETGNGLARSRMKESFVEVVRQMLAAPSVDVIVVDSELIERALARFAKFADKNWGLVDCASLAVMEERSITDAFTSDSDFNQAGFTCLLPN
jgi:predicted nucleic acid-binding protein